MSEVLLLACVVLLVALVALETASFRKIRKVHLHTFDLLSLGATVQRETLTLFKQLQALMALERLLQLAHALPPMRGWAGSPDFLLEVAEELLTHKPTTVMECSSGVSTLVAARCMQLNAGGHVYSLEHDSAYAAKTRALLLRYGMQDWATVIDAPLYSEGTATPWYSLAGLPASLLPIDMLVVDGPPHDVARLARYPALPVLLSKMADRFVVFLDDASRDAEREIVDRWIRDVPGLHLTIIPCEKGLAMLRKGDGP